MANLTKLQKQMNALAAMKCPCNCHEAFFPRHHVCCDTTGLDARYDALRVECEKPYHHGPLNYQQQNIHLDVLCDRHRTKCPGYTTLSADRCHKTVGKLLVACPVRLYPPDESDSQWAAYIPGASMCGKGDTPEKALVAALCESEGITIPT